MMRSLFSNKEEIELDEDLTVLRVREDTILHLNESLVALARIVSDQASQYDLLNRELMRARLELNDRSRALELRGDAVATKHDEYAQALADLHDAEACKNGIREDIVATKGLVEEILSELNQVFRGKQFDTSHVKRDIQLHQFEIRPLEEQIQHSKQVTEENTAAQLENEAELARLEREEEELAAREPALLNRLKICDERESEFVKQLSIPLDSIELLASEIEYQERLIEELNQRLNAFPVDETKAEIAKALQDADALEKENVARKKDLRLKRESSRKSRTRSRSRLEQSIAQSRSVTWHQSTVDVSTRKTGKLALNVVKDIFAKLDQTARVLLEENEQLDDVEAHCEEQPNDLAQAEELRDRFARFEHANVDLVSLRNSIAEQRRIECDLDLEISKCERERSRLQAEGLRNERQTEELLTRSAGIEHKESQNKQRRSELDRKRAEVDSQKGAVDRQDSKVQKLESSIRETEQQVAALEKGLQEQIAEGRRLWSMIHNQ
jgi:hypothetical protein